MALDPRVPIVWPLENLRQTRRDRFRLTMLFFIFGFLDPNFYEGHKIGTLGSRDLILFFEMTIMDKRCELNVL